MASKAPRPHKKKRDSRTLSDVKRLGHELLSSRAHINNLSLLLAYISPSSPPKHTLESLLSLQSFFTTVLPDLPPTSSKPSAGGEAAADPEIIYRTWLRSKVDEFMKSLIEIAISSDCDEMLREIVLDSIMELVKVGNRGRFYSALYHKLLQNIVQSSLNIEFLIELLASKYFKYVDIRYFTYISVDKLAKTLKTDKRSGGKQITANGGDENHSGLSSELSIKKMYFLLSHIPPLGASDEETENEIWASPEFPLKEGDEVKNSKAAEGRNEELNGEKYNKKNISKRMKLKFTKAWMSFLRLSLPLDVYKEVLVNLHQAVIPYISNPAMLCTISYDIGGVVSVMALSGLFILMTQYGIDYPNFYEKLYALLSPSIFMAKHRAKFFQLLDSCLKSTLVPAYTAAAFTKKLSRLSLVVPPSGAMVIIALVHNVLRRHPSINFLVQGLNKVGDVSDSSVNKEKQGVDHFNDEETDPIKTNALKSSLWEIDSLRHHYCPHVSRFVISLENDLTVRAKTSEITVKDFSSGSYSTIFSEEMRRRVKHVPLAFYKATPTSLLSETDFPGWTFKPEASKEVNA
ncbi:LOW QUALITY PROTEIN: hypothetical protein V2J09_016708 [Rumex salicifolius]